MNKQLYISELKRKLVSLKQSAKLEILADIEEHFDNGEAMGKTQEQVAKELGAPSELAAQYLQQAEEGEKLSVSTGAVGRTVLSVVGLFLLDVMIMIPILASLFAVVISLWTVPLSLGVTAIALLILPLLSFITYTVPYFICILIAIALTGLTVASSIGMVYLSKYFIKMVVSYARAHYKIIKGGLKDE